MSNKVVLLLLGFACSCSIVHAQKKNYLIKADSIKIFNNCDTAEFILENRTRSVLNGVLTNKGNGVTEFRKVMVKLNDSLYTIGGDTLNAVNTGKNIYNSNGVMNGDRIVDGNNKSVSFNNNNNFLVSNNNRPVVVSRTPIDSATLARIEQMNSEDQSPYTGLMVRGTGCDATIELVSDSAGTCKETQAIDFVTLRPRKDSWLTNFNPQYSNKYLMGRIQLESSNEIAEYSALKFTIKSDTAFFNDGAYTLFTPGKAGGNIAHPALSIYPSFKHPRLGYNTKMPYVMVGGGLFVGFSRDWYLNSKNANDLIYGVDDVPGYLQPFYETRFSVYADSMPLKIYKLPAIKGNAFLTYSPTRTVEGNNVAFEYKDSVYEDIRNYISINGLPTPSDQNLKENIAPSQFNSAKLLHLVTKDFNYKTDKNKTRYTGLMAQELKAVIPELVAGKEGNYSIDYVKMVPYLLKSLQDQQLVVQDQQKEIALLKEQADTGKTVVNDLKLILEQVQKQLIQQQEEIARVKEKLKN